MGKQNYFFSGITDILILAILCEHDSYVYEIVKFIKEKELPKTVRATKENISAALHAGANVETGHGHGPLNHFFDPVPLIKIEV